MPGNCSPNWRETGLVMEIAVWLRGLSLERYAEVYRDNVIELEVLPGHPARIRTPGFLLALSVRTFVVYGGKHMSRQAQRTLTCPSTESTRRSFILKATGTAACSTVAQKLAQAAIVQTDTARLPPIPLPAGIRSRVGGQKPTVCAAPARISGACLCMAQGDAAPRFCGISCTRAGHERLWSDHRVGRQL